MRCSLSVYNQRHKRVFKCLYVPFFIFKYFNTCLDDEKFYLVFSGFWYPSYPYFLVYFCVYDIQSILVCIKVTTKLLVAKFPKNMKIHYSPFWNIFFTILLKRVFFKEFLRNWQPIGDLSTSNGHRNIDIKWYLFLKKKCVWMWMNSEVMV